MTMADQADAACGDVLADGDSAGDADIALDLDAGGDMEDLFAASGHDDGHFLAAHVVAHPGAVAIGAAVQIRVAAGGWKTVGVEPDQDEPGTEFTAGANDDALLPFGRRFPVAHIASATAEPGQPLA